MPWYQPAFAVSTSRHSGTEGIRCSFSDSNDRFLTQFQYEATRPLVIRFPASIREDQL